MSDKVRSSLSRWDLTRAAAAVTEQLGVSGTDRFLLVCNPGAADLAAIAVALLDAAHKRTRSVNVCEYPAGTRDGEEPPDAVAAALRRASVAVLLTRFSISHTQARLEATRVGARIASMGGISREVFARTLLTDYDQLQRDGRSLAEKLSAASRCRVTTPAGTDLLLSLERRAGICDDGDLRELGSFGNLPAGEAYIAPHETDATGQLVFDGSLGGWGRLDKPLAVLVEGGRVVDASEGGAGCWLLETLDAGGPNGRVIAELGIGTNPQATVSGLVLEDEKAYQTAHVAFGTNTGIGGVNRADVHIDALVLRPRIELDGKILIEDGLPVG